MSSTRQPLTPVHTLSLHDALPIFACDGDKNSDGFLNRAEDQNAATTDKFEMTCTVTFREDAGGREVRIVSSQPRSEEHTSELQSHHDLVCRLLLEKKNPGRP